MLNTTEEKVINVRGLERKRKRFNYLSYLLRQSSSEGLVAIADSLLDLEDSEVLALVDKLKVWLI